VRGARAFGAVCAALAVGACVESRIVEWDPMLAGLPGSETQGPVARRTAPPLPESFTRAYDGLEPGDRSLVLVDDDGNRTLVIRSGRDLMHHIAWTLEEGERELFAEQVLSAMTREEFRARGLDPREAFDLLEPNQRGVRRLFARMPQAELTPGMIMKPVGGGVYRLQVRPGPDMVFSGMDMVNEAGRWRLRWFVR